MAGPIAIDTPDYQRGVVSAQTLLATVPGTTTAVTVGVPPNAETLVVSVPNLSTATVPSVFGLTSGQRYAGAAVAQTTGVLASPTWFFDVSSVTDDQVQVEFPALLDRTWYVYADAAAHVVADLSKLVNQAGQQYTIPSAPSTAGGDHPPNELQSFAGNFNAASILLPAPGTNRRYRLFNAAAVPLTAGSYFVELGTSAGGASFLAVTGNAGASVPFYPSGLPCQTNGPITLGFSSSGDVAVSLTYTVESV